MKQHPELRHSEQLLLVLSSDWNATRGILYQYDRPSADAAWKLRDSFPVSLGKNGLAWGRGLAKPPDQEQVPVKKEGDSKTPAGMFALQTAFGSAPPMESGIHNLPYLQTDARTLGIDDAASRYYNQIVNADRIANPDWKSAEVMLHPDGLYRLGVFVEHNSPKPLPGLGSCIFLHIWRGEGRPTTGCTAMSAGKMEQVAKWLNAKSSPRLLQLPRREYQLVREAWGLPKVAQESAAKALDAGSVLSVFVCLATFRLLVKRSRRT